MHGIGVIVHENEEAVEVKVRNQRVVLVTEDGVEITGTLSVSGEFTPGSELSEIVAASRAILAAESGKTFYLNDVDGFTLTLPAPAAGLNYKFIVKLAPTEASYTVDTGAANIIYGVIDTVPADDAGVQVTAQQLFNFVVDVALIGDWAEVRSDGTNWYIRGGVNVVEALTVAQA